MGSPTFRQIEILQWISTFAASSGFPPTLREMMDRFGIASTNGAADHVRALERRGLITRQKRSARSIVVTAAGKKWVRVSPVALMSGSEVA